MGALAHHGRIQINPVANAFAECMAGHLGSLPAGALLFHAGGALHLSETYSNRPSS